MKSKRLLSTVLALTLVSSSALIGCDKKPKDEPKKPEEKKETGEGEKDAVQEMTYAAAVPAGMDPATTTTNSEWWPQGYVYEGIIRNTLKDGKDVPGPGVAEKWDISDDKLTYTFHLRKDAKWADGQPVTAKDFEYSWKRVLDPKLASKNANLLNGLVKNASDVAAGKKGLDELGVKAKDDYTFVVELENPCTFFLQYCFHPVLKPVRKDYIDKYKDKYGLSAEAIMGNGAYKVTKYEKKSQMIFEKNDNYWNKDTRFITKVTFNDVREANAKYSALLNGEIDTCYIADQDQIATLKQDDKFTYKNKLGANIDFFTLNHENQYLKNTKIRKALAVSFDRDKYVETMQKGLADPAYTMVPPTITCDGKEYNVPGKNDFIKDLAAQVKDPKALLIEGLKELGKPADPSKVTLRLMTRGNETADKENAEFFQQQWKDSLGINIEVDMVDYTIMYEKIDKGDFDIAQGGWFADQNDPSNFLGTLNSKDGYYSGEIKWKNKDFDEKYFKAFVSTDTEERIKLYHEAEKIAIVDEVAVIPYYFTKSSSFRRTYLKNYDGPTLGFEDLEGVYISGKQKK